MSNHPEQFNIVNFFFEQDGLYEPDPESDREILKAFFVILKHLSETDSKVYITPYDYSDLTITSLLYRLEPYIDFLTMIQEATDDSLITFLADQILAGNQGISIWDMPQDVQDSFYHYIDHHEIPPQNSRFFENLESYISDLPVKIRFEIE